MKDGLPFALALFFIIAQPVLDRIWLQHYMEVLDPANSDNIENPAKWVADVAQFLPSASLTIVGVALLLPEDEGNATVIAYVAGGLIVAFFLFVAAGTRGRPGVEHAVPYSWLQIVLFVLNAVGLILAIVQAQAKTPS
ncbi:hypothetical protein KDN32_20785 [Nocardioides sp. J2M5]|uniref:hypothetical protein n=1 Tax=Nocardioides palaemonis TaxID=2829810 RepID=UPI001BAA7084|nr:hypothetical protein [Nocardioides palaemonis]MBS2940180.1 hypothetical protein [Nocardioides palaemonis]